MPSITLLFAFMVFTRFTRPFAFALTLSRLHGNERISDKYIRQQVVPYLKSLI